MVGVDWAEIGSRIKYYRVAKNVTGKELANAIGVTQSFISTIEGGGKKISLETIQGICSYLKISMSDFFATTDTSHIPDDIRRFSVDPNNHDLIRIVRGMQITGYGNEVILEWVNTLMKSLESIAKKYKIDHTKPKGIFIIADDDLSPNEIDAIEEYKKRIKSGSTNLPGKWD